MDDVHAPRLVPRMFRREAPLLMDSFFKRPDKSSAPAMDLLTDVRQMLAELIHEPCINQYIRDRTPDMDGMLPPATSPAPDVGGAECQTLLAEYTVLEELDWALQSIVQGDASEIVRAYRTRHDRGIPAWASDWGFKEAFG